MRDPGSLLAGKRVAIIGLGLMGGSLAMALRGHVAGLVAVDPDADTRLLALERGIVDQISPNLGEIDLQVDVIVLAAPVGVILEHIRALGDLAAHFQPLPERRIVMDLGSTKSTIVEAMKTLPPVFDPIGGHPMCGKETSGLAHAEAAIYQGATFAFTPLARTGPQARAFAGALADAAGAVPLWIDPDTHDRWVAATSHLPYMLANALAGVTPPETAPLMGPGFRSTSRLASASRPVMLDILRTNRQPVLEALRRFRDRIDVFDQLLSSGDFSALSDLLASAAQQHQSLVQQAEIKV
jgi:prephenate dehydrogenase